MQWPIPPFPTKAHVGTQVGNSADSANTKSSWAPLLTLPEDRSASWINLGNDTITSSGDRAAIMDLAIGGSGNETILAENLIVGYRMHRNLLFPLHVPPGATLRYRISTPLSFMIVSWAATAYLGEPDSGLSVPGRITTYGAVPASSGGTAITPSGTSNVKGSYVQLTASTTRPIHALMVLAQSSASSPQTARYAIDIAVGGSGSETVILPDHHVSVDNSPAYVFAESPEFVPLSMCIPAGVRLAARCAATSGSQTTPLEVAVYGFTY